MTDAGTGSLPVVVTKAYDLLLWIINHVGKFPRSHRFVLGGSDCTFQMGSIRSAESVDRLGKD